MFVLDLYVLGFQCFSVILVMEWMEIYFGEIGLWKEECGSGGGLGCGFGCVVGGSRKEGFGALE